MAFTPAFTAANNPEGLNPNAYSDNAGGIHNQFIFTPFDFYTPQELTQLYEQHDYGVGYRLMLKTMGFTRGVKAPTTGHFEAPWKKDHLIAGTVNPADVGLGIGQQIRVTLHPSAMFTQTISGTPYTGSYPRVWDIVHFPNRVNAQVIAKDDTVSPHIVTLRPLQAADDISQAGYIVNGARYFISTNAKAEGQALPTGRTSRVIKYENEFQIISEKVSSTGSELTNATYFDPIPGQQGSFFLKGFEDTMYRYEDACDNALIFGSLIDNITQNVPRLGFNVDVKGTEGLIDFGTLYGNTDIILPGLYSMQNIDDVTNIYERERPGTSDIMVWQGFRIYQEIENMLTDYIKQTDVSFTEGARTKLNVKIGFYGIEKSGYRFMFKKIDAFNDVKGAGTTGYDYPNWQIFTPMGMTKDKSSGASVPTLGYEYKELNSYSRENVVIKLDGTGYGSVATHEDDVYDCGVFGEIAAHNACPNCVVIQRP